MPLRLPICTFDAKTGILCSKCEAKLRDREISIADVEVSKGLAALADRMTEANRLTLLRSVDLGGDYVAEVDGPSLALFRSTPTLGPSLEAQLGGRLRVVAAGESERHFLEDLFYPAHVLSVNTVWLPDGRKLTKAVLSDGSAQLEGGMEEKLGLAARELRGIELKVERLSLAPLENR